MSKDAKNIPSSQMSAGERNALIRMMRAAGVELVHLLFSDLHGIVKGPRVPLKKFEESITDGTWFDGSSIEGFSRIQESDSRMFPDISTLRILPWTTNPKEARVICDVYSADGDPWMDPRHVLRMMLGKAREIGYIYNTGPEVEFFLFPAKDGEIKLVTQDRAGYFDVWRNVFVDVLKEAFLWLEAMGLEVEMDHHEVAPNQFEIDFKYSDALTTADNVLTLKHVLQEVARRNGLYACFMPKPIAGINGSGMHVHQSLFTLRGGNAFFDAKATYGLSKIALHFIAGQMHHVRAISAVVAPTVNSYKRLVPGYEAPVNIVWGQRNRSALLRVPQCSPARTQSTRVELRCPDPSSNPYLVFAVMLAAGLDGIQKKPKPPEPFEGNTYEAKELSSLPGSLVEALEELKQDQVILAALGSHFGEGQNKFLAAKEQEWNSYQESIKETKPAPDEITNFEKEKYL